MVIPWWGSSLIIFVLGAAVGILIQKYVVPNLKGIQLVAKVIMYVICAVVIILVICAIYMYLTGNTFDIPLV